jgi:hypothetical protein
MVFRSWYHDTGEFILRHRVPKSWYHVCEEFGLRNCSVCISALKSLDHDMKVFGLGIEEFPP